MFLYIYIYMYIYISLSLSQLPFPPAGAKLPSQSDWKDLWLTIFATALPSTANCLKTYPFNS